MPHTDYIAGIRIKWVQERTRHARESASLLRRLADYDGGWQLNRGLS